VVKTFGHFSIKTLGLVYFAPLLVVMTSHALELGQQ